MDTLEAPVSSPTIAKAQLSVLAKQYYHCTPPKSLCEKRSMCSQLLPMGTESFTPLPPPPVQPFLPAESTFLAIGKGIGALVFKK